MSYLVENELKKITTTFPTWEKVCNYIENNGLSTRRITEIYNGKWFVINRNKPFGGMVVYRIDDEYSWSEICNNADNAPYLSPELKAKDEARYQANQYAMEHGEPDAESFDNPEEQIEYYCNKFNLFFDINGNLINE